MGSARLGRTTMGRHAKQPARPGYLAGRILYQYGAIQDVTKEAFLPLRQNYSPYYANKQKENGKAQLGSPGT
jgi:hypothetical protein